MQEQHKLALRQMLVHQARQHIDYICQNDFYKILQSSLDDWQNKHYEILANLMDVSTNTVKRLFGVNGFDETYQFQSKTQTKICTFLKCEHWQALEEKIEQYIIQRLQEFQ